MILTGPACRCRHPPSCQFSFQKQQPKIPRNTQASFQPSFPLSSLLFCPPQGGCSLHSSCQSCFQVSPPLLPRIVEQCRKLAKIKNIIEAYPLQPVISRSMEIGKTILLGSKERTIVQRLADRTLFTVEVCFAEPTDDVLALSILKVPFTLNFNRCRSLKLYAKSPLSMQSRGLLTPSAFHPILPLRAYPGMRAAKIRCS